MVGRELFPGPGNTSDNDLAAHCRKTVKTNYHPVGTCRMGRGTDDHAVVTPDLKVRGISGLRIVDASIMPTIPSGNTNAPVLAIADKAADILMDRTHGKNAPQATPQSQAISRASQVDLP
jgi:choline dehydrogenase